MKRFRRFSIFSIIGVAVLIGGIVLLNVLIFLGVEERVANLVQAVTSVTASFLLNFRFTFRDIVRGSKVAVVARYIIFKVLTIGLNDFLFVFFTRDFHFHYNFVYFLNVGIIMLVNYFGYKWFVFTPRDYQKIVRFFIRRRSENPPDIDEKGERK